MASVQLDTGHISRKRGADATIYNATEPKYSMSTASVHKCCDSVIITRSESASNAGFALVFLLNQSRISFHGKANMSLLFGPSVTILGAHLRKDPATSYFLFSPNSHANLVVQQSDDDKGCIPVIEADEVLCSQLTSRYSPELAADIFATISHESITMSKTISILLFESVDCRITASLSHLKRFKNLFSFAHLPCIPKCKSLCNSLGFAFSECFEEVGFHVSSMMLNATERLNTRVSQIHSDITCDQSSLSTVASTRYINPTCLVAGPRGVGKSSFIRFSINRYLTSDRNDKCVAVLDCDIGQPEFTPPGMISITLVSHPLFGPPFTHQIIGAPKPIRQCFVGSITPSDDPKFYLDCLKYVYEAYTNLPNPKPLLLVNTMGWTQGLGITFLIEQILLTRPNLVIQLQLHPSQPGARQNLPVLDSSTLQNLQGWDFRSLSEETFEHEVVVVPAPNFHKRPSVQIQHHWGAPDHRDLTFLAYITACLADAQTSLPALNMYQPLGHPVAHFLDCLPYVVNVADQSCNNGTNKLGIRLLQPTSGVFKQPVDVTNADRTIACLNATVVGLCAVPKDLIEPASSQVNSFSIIRENPVCECLGLAVCRAVDPVQRILFLTTGIPEDDLLKVTGIVRGNVNLPQCFFLEQPVVPCPSEPPAIVTRPYLGPSETQGIGRAGLPSRRAYPKTQHHSVHRTGSLD